MIHVHIMYTLHVHCKRMHSFYNYNNNFNYVIQTYRVLTSCVSRKFIQRERNNCTYMYTQYKTIAI